MSRELEYDDFRVALVGECDSAYWDSMSASVRRRVHGIDLGRGRCELRLRLEDVRRSRLLSWWMRERARFTDVRIELEWVGVPQTGVDLVPATWIRLAERFGIGLSLKYVLVGEPADNGTLCGGE